MQVTSGNKYEFYRILTISTLMQAGQTNNDYLPHILYFAHISTIIGIMGFMRQLH